MDAIIALLSGVQPQHWLILGFVLLIAELVTGTTYLLWPAVAAFITALISFFGITNWIADIAIFAILVIVLTAYGRPIVARWRNARAGESEKLNQRGQSLIGGRGVVAAFANGVGSVKVNDTIWRATSDESLEAGQTVEIASVDGVTLKVKRT
jgi:membrane protein implicated in regulation of membrane protease activity